MLLRSEKIITSAYMGIYDMDLCQYSRHKNVENFLFFCAKVK